MPESTLAMLNGFSIQLLLAFANLLIGMLVLTGVIGRWLRERYRLVIGAVLFMMNGVGSFLVVVAVNGWRGEIARQTALGQPVAEQQMTLEVFLWIGVTIAGATLAASAVTIYTRPRPDTATLALSVFGAAWSLFFGDYLLGVFEFLDGKPYDYHFHLFLLVFAALGCVAGLAATAVWMWEKRRRVTT